MSKWQGTGALVLWIDIDPAVEREADAWYVDEHLPERVTVAGYRKARRYVALEGSPRYLSVFEADTPEALASEGYLRLVREISQQSHRIRAGFSNVIRNTFRVSSSYGRATGGVVGCIRLEPTRLTDLGEAEAKMAELVARLASEHCIVGAHWLIAAPEIRAQLDAVRAVGQQDAAASHVLVVEATQPEEVHALRGKLLSATDLAERGWREAAFGIYRLLVEFS